jgi:hypothetical protein
VSIVDTAANASALSTSDDSTGWGDGDVGHEYVRTTPAAGSGGSVSAGAGAGGDDTGGDDTGGDDTTSA